jgi:hypothetical protein
VWTATEVSSPKKYEVFSLPFPYSSRTTKMREAALEARPIKLPPNER